MFNCYVYLFVAGDTGGFIEIDRTTGAIVLAKALDYETLTTTAKELRFVIKVEDTGSSTGNILFIEKYIPFGINVATEFNIWFLLLSSLNNLGFMSIIVNCPSCTTQEFTVPMHNTHTHPQLQTEHHTIKYISAIP